MSLVKFDPFRNFDTLARRMNTMLTEFDKDMHFKDPGFEPIVDIHEDENNIYLEAEIPGVKKEDIKVSINEEHSLVIKGKKERQEKKEENKDGNTYLRIERHFGEFSRSFMLPENVDHEKISAEFKDGVLNVTLSKKEPEKPKELSIDIK